MSTKKNRLSCGPAKGGKGYYEVGRGKPPLHSRWQKGQSGNPNGRAKGCLNWTTIATELADELAELVSVQGPNGKRQVSKQKAFFKTLINDALTGDARDKRLLLDALLRLADLQAPDTDSAAHEAIQGGADVLEHYVQRAIRRRGLTSGEPNRDDGDDSVDCDDGEDLP